MHLSWGFAERIGSFRFAAAMHSGGGGDGARLKDEHKAPSHATPITSCQEMSFSHFLSLQMIAQKVLKLFEFERPMLNPQFPLFAFLGAVASQRSVT